MHLKRALALLSVNADTHQRNDFSTKLVFGKKTKRKKKIKLKLFNIIPNITSVDSVKFI